MFRYSTRAFLALFSLVLTLPLGAAILYFAYQFNKSEQARVTQIAEETALRVGRVVDSRLSAGIEMLRGLGASNALLVGDLNTFRAEALRITANSNRIIILRDLETTQFINTQLPPSTSLPPAVPLTVEEVQAFQNGNAVVGSVYQSPITGEARVPVAIPVVYAGQAAVLALTFPTKNIHELIAQNYQEPWIIGIGDSRNNYVARSVRHDEVTGRPVLQSYVDRIKGERGSFVAENFEGTLLLAGYFRSPFSNWIYAANIPHEIISGPYRLSVMYMVLTGFAGISGIGLFIFYLGRRYSQLAGLLSKKATELGSGAAMTSLKSNIKEFAHIDAALTKANDIILQRENEEREKIQRENLLSSVLENPKLHVGIAESTEQGYRLLAASNFARQTLSKDGNVVADNFKQSLDAVRLQTSFEEHEYKIDLVDETRVFWATFRRLSDIHVAFAGVDITAEHDAKRTATDTSRELAAVLNSVPAGVWFTYDQKILDIRRNSFAARLLGAPEKELRLDRDPNTAQRHWYKGEVPLPLQEYPLMMAMSGKKVSDQEYKIVLQNGQAIWLLMSAEPILGEQGNIIGSVAVALDITVRKAMEENNNLLVRELNHRVKNMLAIVQSICNRTLASNNNVESARQAVTLRIAALARAHDLLTQENWHGAALRTVVADGLSVLDVTDRYTAVGPDIWVPPTLALAFSMVLHELATNALKYGSLSVPEGQVQVEWSVSANRIIFIWQEKGGPRVSSPSRQGFGFQLLRRGFAAALIEFSPSYNADGFHYRFVVAMDSLSKN